MIEKYLLVIDDEREDKSSWKNYVRAIEATTDFKISFDYINPLEFLDKKNGFELLQKHLAENFLDQKVDLVACDFNWGDFERKYAFLTIDFIRQYNQVCNICLYSGGVESMFQYIADDVKKSQKKILPLLIGSNISEVVARRKSNLIRTTKKLLLTPSFGLQIEAYLLKFQDFTFEYDYEIFEGKTLGDIAVEVRKQSNDGIRYTEYIIKKGLNHMIDLQIS